MSDFKAAFRQAAQSQKVLSKEQIKALKAKKQAEKEASERAAAAAAAARSMPPPPAQACTANRGSASAGPGPGSAAMAAAAGKQAALPADFFDTKSASATTSATKSAGNTSLQRQGQAAPVQPARGPQQGTTSTSAPTAAAAAAGTKAVPAGFFDDKQADAKARGIKLPDKADKEEAFKAFQQQMDEQLKEDAAVEAEEAAEEAEDRQEREEFEQFMLVQHVEELRALKGQKRPAVEVDEAILAALPKGKRRRPIDVLAQLEGDDDSEDEDEDADGVLDWRAKAM